MKILTDCKEFASPYMKDIIVYSKTWDKHKQDISQVLQCFMQAGLTANPDNSC